MFLKERDTNTGFVHRLANSHRCTNAMRGVEVEGILYEDESVFQDQVVGFYKSLYRESESWRPTIDGLEFANLDEIDRLSLEREFEKKEITEALQGAEGDKAPSLDGFTMVFFQKCWCVLEREILAFFAGFHKECIFEKSLNATFLCLIPKKIMQLILETFALLALWVVCTSCYQRFWLIDYIVFWINLFPTPRILFWGEDRFLTLFLSQMNAWTVD